MGINFIAVYFCYCIINKLCAWPDCHRLWTSSEIYKIYTRSNLLRYW